MTAVFQKLARNRLWMKYGGNTAWLLAERAVQMGLAFLVGIVIARTLGPDRYGMLTFAVSYCLLWGSLVNFGTDTVAVRELVRRPDEAGTIIGSALALRFAGFCIMTVGIVGSLWFLPVENTVRISIMIVLAGYTGVALSVPDALFQARVETRYGAWATIAASILMAAVNLIACYCDCGVMVFAAANGGLLLLIGIFKWSSFLFIYRKIGSLRASGSELKYLFKQSWWLLLQAITASVAAQIGYLILRTLCDSTAVGYYSVVVKIIACLYVFPSVLSMSVFPAVVESSGDRECFAARTRMLYAALFWGGVAATAFLALCGRPVVLALYGARYAVPADLLWIGALGLPLVALNSAFSRWCVIVGKQWVSFIYSVASAIGTILTAWFCCSRWQLTGAVVAFAMTEVGGFAAMFFCGSRVRGELRRMVLGLFGFKGVEP